MHRSTAISATTIVIFTLLIGAFSIPAGWRPDLLGSLGGFDATDGTSFGGDDSAVPPGGGQGPGSSGSIETVWYSTRYTFGYDGDGPGYRVIQTQEEWLRLWSSEPDLVPPAVDFETRTVLVAFYGTAPTSGFHIEIADVTEAERGHTVTVRVTYPGLSCVVLMVLTHPVHIVSISKSDRPFEWHFEFEPADCS